MKRELFVSICLFSGVVFANTPPEIRGVRAGQRNGTQLVDIYYDVTDADGDALRVRIEVSDDDGVRYLIPAHSLSGDIGAGVTPGSGRHIVWDAGVDCGGEYSERMRVKVIAIDGRGCPGLKLGSEVPSGGFLLGQDGGMEGGGASRHVNIPWSFWLGRYEVTVEQYCEFLNMARAVGYIETTPDAVCVGKDMPIENNCPRNAVLCNLGDSWQMRWNVNKFEPVGDSIRRPAIVTWYGAMAFARFYGYDLPTEAEWEKAARGPDNGAAGSHLKYPWGNEISAVLACEGLGTNAIPSNVANVGICGSPNGYGLYDVVGNAFEWTRTKYLENVAAYPSTEALTNDVNYASDSASRVIRGVGFEKLCFRAMLSQTGMSLAWSSGKYAFAGFRVCCRQQGDGSVAVPDRGLKSIGVETFESWAVRSNTQSTYVDSKGYTWGLGYRWTCLETVEYAASGTKCLYMNSSGGATGSGQFAELRLPTLPGKVVEVRMMVGNFESRTRYVRLYSSVTGNSYGSTSVTITASSGYTCISISPGVQGKFNYLEPDSGLYIDDIEVIYEE